MTTTALGAPGWHDDPANPTQLRWFDGTDWTRTTIAKAERPAPRPAPQAFPADGCQVCGAVPSLEVKLREHHGLLFVQRFRSYRGQWCRDCGLARFRAVQNRTMLFGWWGYVSVFVNSVNVVQNVGVRAKVLRLGTPTGRLRAPLSPVRSVFLGPGFLTLLALPVVIVAILVR